VERLYAIIGATLMSFGLLALFADAAPAVRAVHLVGGGLMLAWSGVRSFGRMSEVMGTSPARFGANSLAQAGLVLVICGLLAYVSVRHPVHWDWTEAKEHSLAQGSLDTIAAIPADGQLEMYAFFTARDAESQAKTLLDQYEYAAQKASRKVSVRWISPNEHPDLAQKFQVGSGEGLVVVC